MNQLYLQFEVSYGVTVNPKTGADAQVRCLVCMNVDENSELRDGDTGFAACYNTGEGNFVDGANTALNYDDPKWTFLGEVKATNKGTAVKSTGKNGWVESQKWNKNKKSMYDYCTAKGNTVNSGYTDDVYYLTPYHDSTKGTYYDYVGLLSKDGFKNTGLNNGENHLVCWVRGPTPYAAFKDT